MTKPELASIAGRKLETLCIIIVLSHGQLYLMLQYGFTVETHNKSQQLCMEKSQEAFEVEVSELGLRGGIHSALMWQHEAVCCGLGKRRRSKLDEAGQVIWGLCMI